MVGRTTPDSLPARLYLLAFDQRRDRLRPGLGSVFGRLLRGGALVDLNVRGLLGVDPSQDRKVRATGTRRTGDPLLDTVLREVAETPGRGWSALVRRDNRWTRRAVRDQLAADRRIAAEPDRVLGLLPITRVRLLDRAGAQALRAQVRGVVLGDVEVARIPLPEAALAALVVVGELRPAISGREAWGRRGRVRELTNLAQDAVPALKPVIRQIRAARNSATSGA